MKNHATSRPSVLTSVERLLLANQYAILERLDPELRHEYARKRRIVEAGDVEHYGALYDSPVPVMAGTTMVGREDLERVPVDRGGALTPW